MRIRVFERKMNRLYLYFICNTCESLLPPGFKTCPVCGTLMEIGAKPHAFRIMHYRVCYKCRCIVSVHTEKCPNCETELKLPAKGEIVEQPVKLEIIGMGRNK